MKKIILVFGLLFLTNMLSAQNWLLGGDLIFTHDRTNPDSPESRDFTRFASEPYFGRYIFKNFAIGGEFGYYCVDFSSKSLRFGPFVEYDFLRLRYLSLGAKSLLGYHIYFDSILDKFSGRSIDFNTDLLLNFFITKNIAIFTPLIGIHFQGQWWDDTVLGNKTNYSRIITNIDGWPVLNDLKLGLKFNF